MTAEDITYKPVDTGNWADLEKLFESRGGPHNCWCMFWRNMNKGGSPNKADKKASLKSYVEKGIPVGLLFYSGGEPFAWCSIGPRNSHRELGGDSSLDNVWSLTCFFIKREYRRQGMTEILTKAAMQYAKENGAKFAEAYPIESDSPSYTYMGFKPVFERLGFSLKHKAGKRRNVMTVEL